MTQKTRKFIARVLIFLLIVLVIFYRWYLTEYSMRIVESYEVNVIEGFAPVLIATQGSEYKDALVSEVIEHYQNDSISFKVIDVTELGKINAENWRGLIVIHTWEKWNPQEDAAKFIHKNIASEKLVVVSTSGSGEERIDHVDAITGASVLTDVPFHKKQLIEKLNSIIIYGPE